MKHALFRCTQLAATAGFLAACGDEPTRPPEASSANAPTGFIASAEARGQLGAALIFARDQSVRGLEHREAADGVAAAFEMLAARVKANDRIGAERALVAARAAIRQYREFTAGDDGGSAADLEAMTLTLDHATALVQARAAPNATSYTEREQ